MMKISIKNTYLVFAFMLAMPCIQAENQTDNKKSTKQIARTVAGSLGIAAGVTGVVLSIAVCRQILWCCSCACCYQPELSPLLRNLNQDFVYWLANRNFDSLTNVCGNFAAFSAALGYISYKYILPKKTIEKEPSILPDNIVIPETF